MKALISISFLFSFCVSIFAQKSTSENVKTDYLKLPSVNIEENNPKNFKYYFGSSEVQLQEPILAKVNAMCVPQGGGLNDVIEAPTNYYQIPAVIDQSIVVVLNENGEITFAERITGATKTVDFGKGKCEHWLASALKKNYEEGKGAFLSEQSSLFLNAQKESGKNIIQNNTFPVLIFESFKVYSGKGRNHNYEDLDLALSKAVSAYNNFDNTGFNISGANELKEAIKIWEKALTELNEEDKKARINKSISKGLYENLGRAYGYLYDDTKAIDSYKKAIDLWGGFSNNRRMEVEEVLKIFQTRMLNNEINHNLVSEASKLESLAKKAVTKPNIQFEEEASKTLTQLKADYAVYIENKRNEVSKIARSNSSSKEAFNIYEGMIVSTANAEVLTINPMMMEDKPKDFPIEICDLTQLNVLTITRLDVEKIPEQIGNLTQLRNLNLSGNNIKTIPAGIGKLTSLKKLNLSGNPIESFSSEIQNCTSLKKLILKGSNLSAEQKKEIKRLLPNTKIKF